MPSWSASGSGQPSTGPASFGQRSSSSITLSPSVSIGGQPQALCPTSPGQASLSSNTPSPSVSFTGQPFGSVPCSTGQASLSFVTPSPSVSGIGGGASDFTGSGLPGRKLNVSPSVAS